MPIVFVHGVNNREEDEDYGGRRQRTDGFLKTILAPRIGLDSNAVTTYFPYWGGSGVKFRWNQASLPNEDDEVEALSLAGGNKNSAETEIWIADAQSLYGPSGVNFGNVSRNRGFEEAVDLVWDTAAVTAKSV